MDRSAPSTAIIKKLFALSGNRCAYQYNGEKCEVRIVDIDHDLIGEICHIEAARKGWPRYNEASTEQYRGSFENLIVLCRNHHTKVDRNPAFTVTVLKAMKSAHEDLFIHEPFAVSDSLLERALVKLNLNDAINHEIIKGSKLPEYIIENLLKVLDEKEVAIAQKESLFKELENKYLELEKSRANDPERNPEFQQHLEKGDYASAATALAAKIFPSQTKTRKEIEQSAKAYYEIGLLQELQLNYKEALINYKKALELQPYNIQQLDALAYLQVMSGDYQNGIQHYTTLLTILSNNNLPEDAYLGRTYMNLGCAYEKIGDYQMSITLQQDAIDAFKSTYENVLYEVGTCYNYLGLAYKNLKEYMKAKDAYSKALEIFVEADPTKKNKYIANTLTNFTALAIAANDKQSAYNNGKAALGLYHMLGLAEHPESANAYYQFGFVLYLLDHNQDALKLTIKALDIYIGLYGYHHDKVASCYHQLAIVYCDLGQHKAALPFAERAASIYGSILGGDHPNTIAANKQVKAIRKTINGDT